MEAVPVVSCHAAREDWQAMGRILFKGFEQVRYFPLRFCQACFVYDLMGRDHVTQDILFRTLGNDEGAVIRNALTASVFSSEIREDLIEIPGRFGVRQLLHQPTLSI